MMRLEVLDKNERVISTHKLGTGLTLLGQSPSAHIQLSGQGIGALHVGIKATGKNPVVMDLGGPTRLKIDGKPALEKELKAASTLLEIGERKLRLTSGLHGFEEVRRQKWIPLSEGKSKSVSLRVRVYVKGLPEEVSAPDKQFVLSEKYGVASPFKMFWMQGNDLMAQVPSEWIRLGGRIQAGPDSILKLVDWANPVALKRGVIYRVFAGAYTVELLATTGAVIIGPARFNPFPKELRKPFSIASGSIAFLFALWMTLFGRPEAKVEEPYTVFARIQNVPIEKIPEPDPSTEPAAGGGSGSNSPTTSAPTLGGGTAASKLAQSLTGGLKNLVGSVLSQSKSSDAVVSENGLGAAAAPAAGLMNPQAGKLSAVGSGAAAVAGATKLGKLAIAGSGQGFSGGSGTGLGTGHGSGIGTGVGQGIGRGGFKLVEEESIVDGGLDKSVIEAVIKNNLGQIKYCYERQLVANPDLFGKVVMLWHINKDGLVENTAVKQTTLGSAPVEQCMIGKISGWKFPQPKNGTRVTVSYPFLFKSTM